jgi:hypothetical protein
MEEELSVSWVKSVDALEVKFTPNPKILNPELIEALTLVSLVNELLTETLLPNMVLLE